MSGKCSCIYNLRHDSHFFEAFNKTKVASREVASSIAFSDSSTGELWYNYSCIGGTALSVIGVNYVNYGLLPGPGPPSFPGKVWVNIISQQRGATVDQAHLLLVQMELFWTISVTTAPYIVCPVLLGICSMYAGGDNMLSMSTAEHWAHFALPFNVLSVMLSSPKYRR